jgi:threonine synthase
MAQIVYYFHAGLRVLRQTGAKAVQFSVPTGNFGNILAGYYASRMGLPVSRLILATNENDILARFFESGLYESGQVAHTISPSMDIQVASNFERFLFALFEGDGARVTEAMAAFARTGRLDLRAALAQPPARLFAAGRADAAETRATLRAVWERDRYLLDPHSAVGVAVGDRLRNADPLICLATAHPAKFPEALAEATGEVPHHPVLDALAGAETRCDRLPAQEQAVRDYLMRWLD